MRAERYGWLLEAVGEAAAYAARGGTRVLLEPVSEPTLDSLRTLDETTRFILDLGSPDALGVMVDGMFAALEGLPLAEALRRAGPRLGGVQVSVPGRALPELG